MTTMAERTPEDARAWLLERLERGAHPLDKVDPAAAREAIDSLRGLDPESWTACWDTAAERYAAAAAEAADPASRRQALLEAYRFSFLGRFPVPNHPAKERQYERARAFFLDATGLDDPPLPRVSGPVDGGELAFYVARPPGVERAPVVMLWGGIDTWKEEMYDRLGGLFRSKGVVG